MEESDIPWFLRRRDKGTRIRRLDVQSFCGQCERYSFIVGRYLRFRHTVNGPH